MDLSKYHNKGLTGLENLGNTCFLNSCLQAMNHVYELHAFLDSDKYQSYLNAKNKDSVILIEWNDLRGVMWSGNGVVTPRRFVHNVQQLAKIKKRDLFTGFAQNDMPEFLLFFIECLHNSIARSVNMRISGNVENVVDEMAIKCYEMLKTTYSREYSEIMELFYGIYVSEIQPQSPLNKKSITPEPYFLLDLPIQNSFSKAVTLLDCFDIFTASEIMDGENAWFNEATGLTETASKRITFWNFPKILILTFKRFTSEGTKINDMIDFPLQNLDVGKYVSGYNASQYKYDLFGVCNHVGGVMGGHYTSFVKNSKDKWYHYNDEHVEEVDNEAKIVTPMAYCLFYRKKNSLV
uniref:USP domain-containing protein n=1 Tax=viral metagenome TaxID=1070528 RepID=A0A6C0I4N7_9ZZZZ